MFGKLTFSDDGIVDEMRLFSSVIWVDFFKFLQAFQKVKCSHSRFRKFYFGF